MKSTPSWAHRMYLRLFRGKAYWHQRFYPPDIQVVQSSGRVWFERQGTVLLEAYPVEYLQGKFKGRCNILLAGPSARTIEDTSLLSRHALMCVSGSPQILGEPLPRMTFYHVNDATYLRDRLDNFLEYAAHAEWTIIDYRIAFEMLRLAPDCLPDTKFVVFDNWAYPLYLPLGAIQRVAAPPRNGQVYCSTDLRMGLATGGTVAYTGGQLAWHFGFDSAYYYGLDLTNTGHAYNDPNPRRQALDKAYTDVIEPAFELLARESSKTGFKLYNCNPNSRLPDRVMPYLDTNDSLTLEPNI
ncbi:hypothetical protein [Coraliomargarita parva]|uniref:hypothetical protein n=1 Tax=Coraliomargarita parva TaxID=3014050 RepID=UPI0022B2BF22|nr:hypothetical protein [Coraliomargarita parva]